MATPWTYFLHLSLSSVILIDSFTATSATTIIHLLRTFDAGWLGSRAVSMLDTGLRRRRARVQIAAATLSGNSLRQTVHTHRASLYRAAKLVAALLRVARVTAGLVESNGSLQPGL